MNNSPVVGAVFKDRKELKAAGLHKHLMAGIDYEKDGNAISIVISGGYKDDEDLGNRIIYTGQGGQSSPGSGIQVKDQELLKGNRALVNSSLNQSPVMVIRGSGGNPKFSPKEGYRYDGLFMVTKHWFSKSVDGPLVIRFELIKVSNEVSFASEVLDSLLGAAPTGNLRPERTLQNKSSRIVRDPQIPKWIKAAYKDKCQICRVTVSTPTSTYSIGAHIRGLGKPHNGPDIVSNMLCLCPNCHLMFDFGTFYIKDDGRTIVNLMTSEEIQLEMAPDHVLDSESIAHHRLHVAGVEL